MKLKVFGLCALMALACTSCDSVTGIVTEEDDFDKGKFFSQDEAVAYFSESSSIAFDDYGRKIVVIEGDSVIYYKTIKDENSMEAIKYTTYTLNKSKAWSKENPSHSTSYTIPNLLKHDLDAFGLVVPEAQFTLLQVPHSAYTLGGKQCTQFTVDNNKKIASYKRMRVSSITATDTTEAFKIEDEMPEVTKILLTRIEAVVDSIEIADFGFDD